jgi:hypothetical protein
MREERKILLMRILRDISFIIALTFVFYSSRLGKPNISLLYKIERLEQNQEIIAVTFGKEFTKLLFLSIGFLFMSVGAVFQLCAIRETCLLKEKMLKGEKILPIIVGISFFILFILGCYLVISVWNLYGDVTRNLLVKGILKEQMSLNVLLQPTTLVISLFLSLLFVTVLQYMRLLRGRKLGYSWLELYIYEFPLEKHSGNKDEN